LARGTGANRRSPLPRALLQSAIRGMISPLCLEGLSMRERTGFVEALHSPTFLPWSNVATDRVHLSPACPFDSPPSRRRQP
jgi:hypothetical protein